MGKGKKKKRNQNQNLDQNASLYKAIKPFIRDNRILFAMLGAMGAGVALAAAVGTDKGRSIVDNLTQALKNLGQPHSDAAAGTTTAPVAIDGKKGKQPKQVTVE
jgi:hypothetical protein